MSLHRKLILGLIILALLSPLGVILPAKFNAGDAWGEWSGETIGKLIGFIPEGMKKNSALWKAPVPDYNLGGGNSSLTVQVVSYIVSGAIGIALTLMIFFILSRFVIKREK